MDTLAKIRARREDIKRRIARFEARLASLSTEVAELDVAERVVARMDGQAARTSSESPAPTPSSPRRHKDLVIDTLKGSPASWFVNWEGLQRTIHQLYGVQIPKSSLMPYLSLLKRDGIIVRRGPNIALRERVAVGAGSNSDDSYDPAIEEPEPDFGEDTD